MARSSKILHPQVCSLENVMAAARSAMQGKMSGHAAARFHARWETHAVRLHEELTAGTWQPGKYTYFDSQFFANVHLDGFDHFVKQELGVKGYVRYVDDFLRKVRLVARAARGLLEQQREQPARIQPQQQRPHEREQQRGVPSRQALEGALPPHR